MMLSGEPYVLDYLAGIEDDLEHVLPLGWSLSRHEVVEEHVTLWRLERLDPSLGPFVRDQRVHDYEGWSLGAPTPRPSLEGYQPEVPPKDDFSFDSGFDWGV